MLYTVRAVDDRGRAVTVRDEAGSEEVLAHALARRGLRIARIVAASSEAKAARSRWSVPRRALADFTDRLQILYAAGVPVLDAMHELHRGARDPRMKKIVARLRADVESGEALSEAMKRFPRAFAPPYLAAVRAGEQSGALDVVLKRLSAQLQWEEWIAGSVRQAFVYPAVLVCAVIGLLVFLFTFLLPRLVNVFQQSGVALPGPTAFVVAVSAAFRDHGVAMLAAAGVLAASVVVLRANVRGRAAVDALLMKLPAVGPILRQVASARFTATLRTLHQTGTPMMRALELSRDAAANAAVAADVSVILERVGAGTPLSEAMAGSSQLEPLVARMVAVGEMSGALTEALDHVVALYDREVQAGTRRLVSLLEPLILLGSGLVVGFVVFATLLPIFRLFGAIRR